MNKNIAKKLKRVRRHRKIRGRLSGTPDKPRLVIFRSITHIYAQIIDDTTGITITSASSCEKGIAADKATKKQLSEKVGEEIGKRAIEKGLKKVVFDRNGYRYHGRVKVLADSARKSGLEF